MFKRLVAVTAALSIVATASPVAATPRDPVREELLALTAKAGVPAALISYTGRDGHRHDLATGVADIVTGRPAPVNGQVRLASNTKTFVAVVVLQLVAEGKIRLDEPVETYLPGLLQGRPITVRQLLQHTSGLADYADIIEQGPIDDLGNYYEPRELLDVALSRPALFPPGAGFSYNNTDYVVAGLLIEKITRRPLAEEITTRVIQRAGLRSTYVPAPGEKTIRGVHPHSYLPDDDGNPVDVSDLDPSWAWAAGDIVGTPGDLATFFAALAAGKLLAPAQLAEMRETVPADIWSGSRYGLGLIEYQLSCGGVAWGHGGDIPAYETRGAATADGRTAVVATTAFPASSEADLRHLVDTALCN